MPTERVSQRFAPNDTHSSDTQDSSPTAQNDREGGRTQNDKGGGRVLRHPVLLFWGVVCAWLVLDRAVKLLETTHMHLGESVALWQGVFHLTYVRNSGAAFSLLEGRFWVFYGAMAVLLVLITWFWHHERPRQVLPVLGTAFVLSGALGNLIDRITQGSVIDIFDLRLINFAVFNVADFGITIGCVLFFMWVLFYGGLSSKGDDCD